MHDNLLMYVFITTSIKISAQFFFSNQTTIYDTDFFIDVIKRMNMKNSESVYAREIIRI
jgi:hypothetical protein